MHLFRKFKVARVRHVADTLSETSGGLPIRSRGFGGRSSAIEENKRILRGIAPTSLEISMNSLAGILQRTWRRFWADRCPMCGAAISYQVLFAIIPVTALLAAGAG